MRPSIFYTKIHVIDIPWLWVDALSETMGRVFRVGNRLLFGNGTGMRSMKCGNEEI